MFKVPFSLAKKTPEASSSTHWPFTLSPVNAKSNLKVPWPLAPLKNRVPSVIL